MPPAPSARRAKRPLSRFAWVPLVSVAAGLATLAALFLLRDPAARLEGVLTDWRNRVWMTWVGPRADEPPSPVTVVDVDERTLEALGLYGESYRAHHARVVEFLAQHHAGAIVFDFLFKTSDSGTRDLARTRQILHEAGLDTLLDSAAWRNLRPHFDASASLERAVAAAPRTILAAQLGDTLDYPNRSDWTPKATLAWQRAIWPGTTAMDGRLGKLPALGTLDNIYPALARAAPRLGLANMEPDPDGKVRRMPLLWRFPARSTTISGAMPAAYPVLALQAGLVMLGRSEREMVWDGHFLDLGAPLRIGKDRNGRMWTSAPGLTWDMCQEIRSRRAALEHLEEQRAGSMSLTTAGGLSSWTEAWWDRSRGRVATSLLALRGSSLRALLDLPESRIASLAPGDTLALGDPVRIPTDAQGAMWLPYGAPSRREGRQADQAWIRHVSYLDVLEGRYDAGQVPGRVFVIGSSASALADFVEAPIERRHPGVDVQALALHSIVSGDFLRPAPGWTDFVVPLALALAAGLCTATLAPAGALTAVTALLAGWFGLSVFAFDRGWWIAILPGLASGVSAMVAAMGLRYILEERHRIFLQDSFKTYISPELIDQMVATGAHPRLGGEEREITAFFTDIQGFSTFSEKIGSPTRLVELVNEYLSAMTHILTQSQGTLDKYIGDAIVAMYGAPVALDDHARRAVEAAVRMQERLAELRRKWQDEGDKWPQIVHHMRMRIGLNTGSIVTGNMGSELRMNYTMMGDDVNLAARLESASKQYGVFLLASDATLRAAGPGYVTREIDFVRVVGRTEPVVVHEILGRVDGAPESWIECVERFAQARALYVQGRFAEALGGFEACKALEPWYGQPGVKNCPSDVFAARCRHFLRHPPGAWDAVHTATEK